MMKFFDIHFDHSVDNAKRALMVLDDQQVGTLVWDIDRANGQTSHFYRFIIDNRFSVPFRAAWESIYFTREGLKSTLPQFNKAVREYLASEDQMLAAEAETSQHAVCGEFNGDERTCALCHEIAGEKGVDW